MEAAPLRSNDSGLEEGNVFQLPDIRLLKAKAIYGSNASGKSNLTKAISAFSFMVSRSVAQEGIPAKIWDDRFKLITDWDNEPIFFQYLFLLNDVIYRYGFQILGPIVTYEWLYSGSKDNEIEYFLRTPDDLKVNEASFTTADIFITEAKKGDNELYRKDSLLLTAGALSGNKLLAAIRDKIRFIIGLDGAVDRTAIQYAINHMAHGSEEQKNAIRKLLNAADTGIEGLEVAELPEDILNKTFPEGHSGKIGKPVFGLFSIHSVYNEDGELVRTMPVQFDEWESDGTSKLLGVGALVLDALKYGRTIVVDELDASFHPNLSLKIVQLFHDEKTNPNKAQLIFVTHDSGLLKRADLRRDQICIVNKDKYGISSLVNLIEFKGVRKDASYEKEYLNGSYSGVPYLDQMDWVITENIKDELHKAQ
jgi:AAA15 family ATPase/GTPase